MDTRRRLDNKEHQQGTILKLLATASELKAIRTICGDYDKLSSTILAAVGPDSFLYAPAQDAYKRIVKHLREQGSVPDWTDVINDPAIPESSRKILKGYKDSPAVGREKVTSILSTLDKYRKLRGMVKLAQHVLDSVEDTKVDLDELIQVTGDDLAKTRARGDAQTNVYHIGKANNSTDLVKEMLYGKSKPSVPTGFKEFDERNGGILLGSLFTIGANTGGGKTAMAVNLLRNMTEFGAEDCCIVPLEMTATQTLDRLMGILSGIEVNRISQKRLTDAEKKVVKARYRKYVQDLKQNNTRFSIYEPDEDVTIEETLMTLKPMGYKVILIDYISLLKGADGDDQWRQLGNIARFAKVFAKNNNCIVVLLCQVSEEGKIRYAQAIAEHSNNAWIWTLPGEEADTSIMDIKQMKARNQLRFNFQLLSHNATMRITDADGSDLPGGDEDEENGEQKDGKKSQRYLKDINEAEDLDADEDGADLEDEDGGEDGGDKKRKPKRKKDKPYNVRRYADDDGEDDEGDEDSDDDGADDAEEEDAEVEAE